MTLIHYNTAAFPPRILYKVHHVQLCQLVNCNMYTRHKCTVFGEMDAFVYKYLFFFYYCTLRERVSK